MCPFGPKCKLQQKYTFVLQFTKVSIFRHILGKKTPRVPGAKFQKQQNKSHRSFSNNQSFRNNKSGSSSQGRRASTSVQFGGNTNMEETWTSISHRWPTWQLFRSALSFPTSLIKSVTAIHHFQAKCTAPSVADGEWYHPTVAQ